MRETPFSHCFPIRWQLPIYWESPAEPVWEQYSRLYYPAGYGNAADRAGLWALLCVVYAPYCRRNESGSIVYLVLAGVIASLTFQCLGSLLKYTADPQEKLPEITYWLMGSFTGAGFREIFVGSPLIIIGVVIVFLLRWRLNVLSLSEDEAKASGIDLKRPACCLYWRLRS